MVFVFEDGYEISSLLLLLVLLLAIVLDFGVLACSWRFLVSHAFDDLGGVAVPSRIQFVCSKEEILVCFGIGGDHLDGEFHRYLLAHPYIDRLRRILTNVLADVVLLFGKEFVLAAVMGAEELDFTFFGFPLLLLVQHKRRDVLEWVLFDFDSGCELVDDIGANIHNEVQFLYGPETLLVDDVLDVETLVIMQVRLLTLQLFQREVCLQICKLIFAHAKNLHSCL